MPDNFLKLSVVIPCFNAAATLAQQLDALSSQQWSEPWELVFSDNGSTDNSREIAMAYKNRFPSFQVVDASARRGGPYALNAGAKAARAERFAVCDADDEVAPGWVAAMGEALSRYDVVCGRFLFDKFNEPAEAEKWSEAWKDGFYRGRFLPGGGSGNYGIRREVHEAVGGFDECLPHGYDADYFWRLQLEGFTLHHVPDAAIQIRIGRVSPSLNLLYRRGKVRAASNYWSYKRYQSFGMIPPRSFGKSLLSWLKVLRRGLYEGAKSRETRWTWLQQFAQQTGEVAGQIQGRLTNPCKPYLRARDVSTGHTQAK